MDSTPVFLLRSMAAAALLLGCAPLFAVEATTDYILPRGLSHENVTAKFFTHKALKEAVVAGFVEHKISVNELDALYGLGVSLSVQDYPPKTMFYPHTHPRASELVHLISGTLLLGFVDSRNELFQQTLLPRDSFVFSKGLPHYLINTDSATPAKCVAAFSSENLGTIKLATALFGSGIEEEVLEKAFNVCAKIIRMLKDSNTPPLAVVL